MRIEFLSSAETEVIEAVRHYNQESEGLGFEFAAELRRTIERIVQYPDAWTIISKRTRRCRMNRFPYGVIYQIRPEKILIVAVFHSHRKPDSWKSRL